MYYSIPHSSAITFIFVFWQTNAYIIIQTFFFSQRSEVENVLHMHASSPTTPSSSPLLSSLEWSIACIVHTAHLLPPSIFAYQQDTKLHSSPIQVCLGLIIGFKVSSFKNSGHIIYHSRVIYFLWLIFMRVLSSSTLYSLTKRWSISFLALSRYTSNEVWKSCKSFTSLGFLLWHGF